MTTSETYTVIRRTWLSRKPAADAAFVVWVSYLVLAFGTLVYWRNLFGAGDFMPASAFNVFADHEYWRLWTTLFAHADPGHFLANSLLFLVLGYFLCGYFGVLIFPGMAFIFGGVINALALITYAPDLKLIGASGMVNWMGGCWLALYIGLNRRITLGQRALRAMGVFLALFAPTETFDPNISHRTHMIGFALGLLWGLYYFLRRKAEFRAAEVSETITEDFNTAPLDDAAKP